MKTNHKKILKFVTLLITSLLIGYASAESYKYMYIQSGQVSISIGGLKWEKGTDGSSATVSGTTVTGLSLQVMNGTPQLFNYTLYIKNLDATGHTFTIEVTSSEGDKNNFDHIYLKLYDNATGAFKAQLDLETLNSQSNLSIDGNGIWQVAIDVDPEDTAQTGTVTFSVKITYQ
jgi:hypothetical protein